MFDLRRMRRLIRAPRVRFGDFLDRWYEEWFMDAAPLGPLGERAAARHLRRRGYAILARNYRASGGEIDLVASDDGTLVFVEVKARSATGYGTPQEAVDERKQSRIRRTANAYRAEYGVGYLPVRFDIVAIIGVGRFRRLELLKNAF